MYLVTLTGIFIIFIHITAALLSWTHAVLQLMVVSEVLFPMAPFIMTWDIKLDKVNGNISYGSSIMT